MKQCLNIGLVLLCVSCSTPSAVFNPQKMEKIAILGMNDFHGSLAARKEKTYEKEGVSPTIYEDGGAATYASMVRVLKKEWGKKLLVVDAGDEWQGTLDSNLEQGVTVVQFFNRLGVGVAAIGNHEFDYGAESGHPRYSSDKRGAMKTRFTEAKYPYVAANIYKKGTNVREEFPNTYPSKIFQLGSIKVGVIGLSTQSTPATTRYDFVDDLDFTDLVKTTLEQSKILRNQGANIVIVTTHAGLNCNPEEGGSLLENKVRRSRDPQGKCSDYDEITEFLNRIPVGTVDLVVAGHTHTIIHHWVNGTPVIQGGAYNHYFNMAYLVYDHSTGQVRPEMTEIEGPIPVCPKVFKNLGHCNGKMPAPPEGRGPLVANVFRGKTITPDADTENLLKPLFARTEKEKSRVIGQAARPLKHMRLEESEYGNLYSDIIRKKLKADVGFMNSGGIRDSIDEGTITYDEIYRTLPFENTVARVEMTGRDIRNFVRVMNNGSHGIVQQSGLIIKMIDLNKPAPVEDINGDGKKEYWETNRIIEILTEDGKPLDDSKTYVVATIDYLVKGGDNLGWVFSQIDTRKIQMDTGSARDAIVEYLKKSGPVNTLKKPLKDPKHPRTIQI